MRWTKYKNYAQNLAERATLKVALKSYPYRLYVDPINVCNLRCPLCPTGQRRMPSPGKMSLETFRRVFDPFADYAEWVGLYNWGEPLLHPGLFEMVGYVASRHIRSVVSTHFSLSFSTQDARDMVRSGLSRLIVSVDGATPQTYGVYRIGGDFDLVVQNLHVLAEAKRLGSRVTPEIVLQFVVFRHNEHEIGAMGDLAKQFGARLSVIPATCDMGLVVEVPPKEAVRRHGRWLPGSMSLRKYDGAGNWRRTTRVCESLWNSLVFRWDGEVYPCCLLYQDEDSLGNIHALPLESIWNGEAMQHARSRFGGSGAADKQPPVACDRCYASGGWNAQDLPAAGVHAVWRAGRNRIAPQLSNLGERLRLRI